MVTAMRPFGVAGFIQEQSKPKRDSALDEYYIPKSWIFAVLVHHASTLQPSYHPAVLLPRQRWTFIDIEITLTLLFILLRSIVSIQRKSWTGIPRISMAVLVLLLHSWQKAHGRASIVVMSLRYACGNMILMLCISGSKSFLLICQYCTCHLDLATSKFHNVFNWERVLKECIKPFWANEDSDGLTILVVR
jgi:hypothetical protein